MLTGKFKSAAGETPMSRIVMGTFTLGSVVPEDQAFELLDRYYALGGRTIDTARSYNGETKNGDSKAERTVCRWLRRSGARKEVTLVTKGGYPELRNLHCSRLSPDCIRYDINTSLAVLDQDYVDLFILHRDDPSIPVGEIVDAASEVVSDGLARAIGVSNWTTARIAEANAYALAHDKTPFTVSQLQWNMAHFTREMMADRTMLPMLPEDYKWYQENHFPVMAYTSQAVGFFSKYPAVGLEGLNPRARVFATPDNIARCERVTEICKELGCSAAALCVAYIANNAVDGYAVIGSSNLRQLEDTMTAADMIISQKVFEQIEKM
ncbi:aldo/keto reductase [Intestinibacillus massiliensis]|nr:aldo/keto reductase [Intestinibacillus massiliensis]